MTTRLKINGMSCKACVGHVEQSLKRVPDVDSVQVDLGSGLATVEHHGASEQKLMQAVSDAGYEAQPAER
jgi:copper chaperone